MPAVFAPSPRLLADPADPFVAANGLIPRLTRSMALKSTSIDVVTTAKQATKEVDFRFWGRLVSYGWLRDLICILLNVETRGPCLAQFSKLAKQFLSAGIELGQLAFRFGEYPVDFGQGFHRYSVAVHGLTPFPAESPTPCHLPTRCGCARRGSSYPAAVIAANDLPQSEHGLNRLLITLKVRPDDKTRRLAVPHPTRMPSRRIVQWLHQTQLGELAIIGTSFTL